MKSYILVRRPFDYHKNASLLQLPVFSKVDVERVFESLERLFVRQAFQFHCIPSSLRLRRVAGSFVGTALGGE